MDLDRDDEPLAIRNKVQGPQAKGDSVILQKQWEGYPQNRLELPAMKGSTSCEEKICDNSMEVQVQRSSQVFKRIFPDPRDKGSLFC